MLDTHLTFKHHISHILTSCTRTTYYLKALRSHGLTTENLHQVFSALILPKITYASQAWWGFVNEQEKDRLEKFLNRAKKWGYCNKEIDTIASTVNNQSKTLFSSIQKYKHHKLNVLLPSTKVTKYNLRRSSFNIRVATQNDLKNFIPRMILNSL